MVFQVLGPVFSALSDLASIGVDSAYAVQSTNVDTVDDYVRGANENADPSQLHQDYVSAGSPSASSAAAGVTGATSSSSLSSVSSVISLLCLMVFVMTS